MKNYIPLFVFVVILVASITGISQNLKVNDQLDYQRRSVAPSLFQNTSVNASNTLADTQLFTGTVSANSMGSNGCLRILFMGDCDVASVGGTNKLFLVKFGGNIISAYPIVSGDRFTSAEVDIMNRNNPTSQISVPNNTTDIVWGATSRLPSTYSIDTTVDQQVSISSSNLNLTDSVNLRQVYITILKANKPLE